MIRSRPHAKDVFEPVTDTDETRRILFEADRLLEEPFVRKHLETPHAVFQDFLEDRRDDLAAPSRLVAVNALVLLKELLGPRPDFIRGEIGRYRRALERFVELYGEGPVAFLVAPARIELCGGHIDYIDYFQDKVLAFGSREYYLILTARPRADRRVRAVSMQPGFAAVDFSLDEFPASALRRGLTPEEADQIWLEYLDACGFQGHDWANYLKSSFFYLQHLKPDQRLCGADVVVDSTIPIAGGASSSSAVVTSAGYAVRLFNGRGVDAKELGVSSGKAEWYVGTRGGNMDHATMAFSQVNHACLITFQPFEVKPVPMPTHGYRWITFFTTEAAKTDALIVKDGEISAVSIEILPMLLDVVLAEDAELQADWGAFRRAIEANDTRRLETARGKVARLLDRLPETITFGEIAQLSPEAAEGMKARFPKLYEDRGETGPLPIRRMARYHLGEIVRVIEEAELLANAARHQIRGDAEAELEAMQEVGRRLDATHEGLCSDYGVGGEEPEEVQAIAKSCEGVLGARIMGFGLGGNVLVLVRERNADALIERVRRDYYEKRGRPADQVERDICVHTPGPGLRAVDFGNAARRRLLALTADWERWAAHEDEILNLAMGLLNISSLDDFVPSRPVKPVIFAGGKGTRAKLDKPKVLAEVLGEPSLLRVLDAVTSLPNVGTPLLIVSDHKGYDQVIRDALDGRHEAELVVETDPRGTGHAMLQAEEALAGFEGTVLVTEGVQAAVRRSTLRKSLLVHEALALSAMTLPTARRERPYAYLVRDKEGMVSDSRETHLEQARIIDYGEDNVSLYLLDSEWLFPALHFAKARNRDPETGGYRGGGLGFPNEMVRSLSQMGRLVVGLCMADPREAKSIKYAEDVDELGDSIRQLEAEGVF